MARVHRVPRIKSSAEVPQKRMYRFKVLAGNLQGVESGGVVRMLTTESHAKRLVESGRAKIMHEPDYQNRPHFPMNRPEQAVDEEE